MRAARATPRPIQRRPLLTCARSPATQAETRQKVPAFWRKMEIFPGRCRRWRAFVRNLGRAVRRRRLHAQVEMSPNCPRPISRLQSSCDFFITAAWKSAMARNHPSLRVSSASKASTVTALLPFSVAYWPSSVLAFRTHAPGMRLARLATSCLCDSAKPALLACEPRLSIHTRPCFEIRRAFDPSPPSHPLVESVTAMLRRTPRFTGTATALAALLSLSQTPKVLSAQLKLHAVDLADAGIHLDFNRRHGGVRTIDLCASPNFGPTSQPPDSKSVAQAAETDPPPAPLVTPPLCGAGFQPAADFQSASRPVHRSPGATAVPLPPTFDTAPPWSI